MPNPKRINDNRFLTLFFNAFRLRCPVCKEGKIFPGWFEISKNCPTCGVQIDRGPGYFLGSIYFNYGATSVIAVVTYLIGMFVYRLGNWQMLPPILVFVTLFPLYFLRYARASWLVFDQYFNPRRPGSSPQ